EPGARAGWNPLHQALRDPARNALYDALGLEEESADAQGRRAQVRADCADTLYALRGYFAWKLGLPFLLHQCARGDSRRGPDCRGVVTNLDPMQRGASRDRVRRFSQFNGRVASLVMSGTTRTLPDDEAGDFYPVALTRASLRPGTVFVNPNGHVLMVSQWTRQRRGQLGALYAVDGHPGFSVTHKAFSPSLFPFVSAVDTGGFKMFRPAVLGRDGQIRPMTDREIAARRYLPRRSVQQAEMTAEQFYARIDRLQNPRQLDPVQAARDVVFYLHKVARERARIVDAAPRRFDEELPQRFYSGLGASRAWRRHSTARLDLRLLLAIDQVREMPQLARRGAHPLARPATEAELRAAIDQELAARSVSYRASDRTARQLTLAQLVERRERLLSAYHPSDCPEVRWGAADRSDEQRTCGRRASPRSAAGMRRAAGRLRDRWEPNDR
ncbi:MAG: hypothetical protein IT379_35490, partial [Deltaproteobacteria bacterium]|nr:hypothetical protein [Deltaproteobacteria bacterium]